MTFNVKYDTIITVATNIRYPMSGMHLLPAMYTTTGKQKTKRKWASADAKRKAEQLNAQWQAKLDAWGVKNTKKVTAKSNTGKLTSTVYTPPGRETPRIESQDTGWVACTRPADKTYTGTKIRGIGTMHKSNAVPVFSEEEAIEISQMRRN